MPCGYLHIYKPFFRVAEQIPQGSRFLYARYQVTRYWTVTSKTAVKYTLILYSIRQSVLQFTQPQSRFTCITVFPAILLRNSSVVWVYRQSNKRWFIRIPKPPASLLISEISVFPFLFVTNSCPLTTEG